MSTEFILIAIPAACAITMLALGLCVAAGRADENLLREEHHDPPNPLPGAGDSRSPSRAPGSGDTGMAEFDVELEHVMWWWAR